MATLPNKLTEFRIRKQGIQAGEWLYIFTVNNLVSELGQVNFGSSYDEGLDGDLRQNFRGFRLSITLDFAKLLSSTVVKHPSGGSAASSTVRAFLNDIITSFTTDGDDHVDVSFSSTYGSEDWREMILDSSSLKTAYTNQIARESASIKLIGKGIITSIPEELQSPS
tara:strand:+ start:128 stop:628 length:501 start_codon:yes stop_codon:yes gene_type:complete